MGTTGIQLKHLKYSLPMLQQCIFTTSPVLGRFAVRYVGSPGFILTNNL